MTLLLTLLIVAVIGLVVAVAAGRIVGGLDQPASSLPGRGLPPDRVGVEDLERVRFSPALRGYRMDEVDDVLDRLTDELRRRDEELEELRAQPPFGGYLLPGRPPVGQGGQEGEEGPRPAPLSDACERYGARRQGERYPEPFASPRAVPVEPPAAGRDEPGGG